MSTRLLHRSRQALRSALLLLMLSSGSTCGGPSDLIISVPDWPAGAERMRVRATLNGNQASDFFVDKGESRIVIRLPEGSDGEISVDLAALDDKDCKLATSLVSRSVPTGLRHFAEETPVFTPLMPHRCTLTVKVANGKGSTTSQPAGIDCKETGGAGCEADFDSGTMVGLSPVAGLRHYGGSWGDPCKGLASCTVKLERSTQLSLSFAARSCNSDGWCWHSPLPTGNQIVALSGSSETDAWAVGEAGTILHWDGQNWNGSNSGVSSLLMGVWETSPSDVWAVGTAGTLLHWDGSAWAKTDLGISEGLSGVWASGPSDVWVSGERGKLLHWNGSRWATMDAGAMSSALLSIWGTAPDDIWMVGSGGAAFHFNGKIWETKATGVMADLLKVTGTSKDDVWAVGKGGTTLHWTGATWTQEKSNVSGMLASVWAQSSNDIWAAGDGGILIHWNGVAWSSFPSGTTLSLAALWGASSTAIWAAGDRGTFIQYDGITWKPLQAPSEAAYLGVWGSSDKDVWAVGTSGLVQHWTGDGWHRVETQSSQDLNSIWGSGPSDIWAVGSNGAILHWDGTAWSPSPSGTSMRLTSVVGGPSDVFVAGSNYDGTKYSSVVLRLTGKIWRPLATPPFNIVTALWPGPDELLAVGAMWTPANPTVASVARFQADTWASIPTPVSSPVDAVWGSGSKDAWIAGGSILRMAGGVIQRDPLSFPGNVFSLWGSGANDVWGVGGMGAVLHWNGMMWKTSVTGQSITWYGVWGSGPKDVWMVGDKTTILHYEPLP